MQHISSSPDFTWWLRPIAYALAASSFLASIAICLWHFGP